MVEPHYKLQFSEADIAREVSRLGREINAWCQDVHTSTGQDVLTIPVLRGGIFFFTDLVRCIDLSVEIAPGRTHAYEHAQNFIQAENVTVHLDNVAVKDRSVLLVDDICDSGRTLKVLSEYIMKEGAREVRSAVLIKRIHSASVFNPEWVGFEYTGDEWFVGYGMEDSNRWSNLPSIYTIQKS